MAAILEKVDTALGKDRSEGLEVANAAIKSAGSDKKAEAYALLALGKATVFESARGSKPAEDALKSAKKALSLFKAQKDKAGEASALVVVSSAESNTEKAAYAAKNASRIFRELQDKKGESTAAYALMDAELALAGPEKGLLASERALQLAKEAGSKKDENAALQSIMGMHIQASNPDKAMSVAAEALKLAKDSKDSESYMATLSKVLLVQSALKSPEQAQKAAEEGLKLFEELGDKKGRAGMLCMLANTFLEQKQWEKAVDPASEALKIYKELNDKKGVFVAMRTLIAVLAMDRQKLQVLLDKACTDVALDGLEFFKKSKDKRGEVIALQMLAFVFFQTEQPKQAMSALGEARKIYKDLGDKEGEVTVLNSVVAAFMERGEVSVALTAVGDLFALYLSTGDQAGQVEALLSSANIHYQKDDVQKAGEVAKDALGIAKELGDKRLELKCLENVQGTVVQKKKDTPKALKVTKEILGIARELGEREKEASALYMLAQLGLREGDTEENYANSASTALEAIELLEDAGDRRGQLPILELIYSIQRAMSRTMEALETARAMVDIMKDIEFPQGIAGASILCAEAEPKTMEALESAQEAVQIFEALGDKMGQAVAQHLIFKCRFVQKNTLQQACEAAREAKNLFQEAGDPHGEAVALNSVANGMLHMAYAKKDKPEQVTNLCKDATIVAREALDKFGSIGDAYGRELSMNIIKDMKKLNDTCGSEAMLAYAEEGGEESAIAQNKDLDASGLPLVDPYEEREKIARQAPKVYQPEGATFGMLDIDYAVFDAKEPPNASDEHRQLFAVGQFPKLFQSVLKARKDLASTILQKTKAVRGEKKQARGIAAPMRKIPEVCLQRVVVECGVTGGCFLLVGSEHIGTSDIVESALQMIRCTQGAGEYDPIPLDMVTSSSNHAAPNFLPESRPPLLGPLIGLCRTAQMEFPLGEIRLLDIEEPRKRRLLPYIYFNGPGRQPREVIIRNGHVFMPRLVSSGARPHYPGEFQMIHK
mmetsp:Transcript_37727/g.70631  ORF Transcript_37727/g.70631 Transcript_37727/m.70631 type:complete len:1002 (+) Transcript_37727:46-3051(+)